VPYAKTIALLAHSEVIKGIVPSVNVPVTFVMERGGGRKLTLNKLLQEELALWMKNVGNKDFLFLLINLPVHRAHSSPRALHRGIHPMATLAAVAQSTRARPGAV
jgi:hypothetical protein